MNFFTINIYKPIISLVIFTNVQFLKICVCTGDTEPFLKHCVDDLVFLLVSIVVGKRNSQTGLYVVYNQVLTSGFCWSLTSSNVNRFRLAFALK